MFSTNVVVMFNQRCFLGKCFDFKAGISLKVSNRASKFRQCVRYLHRNKDSKTSPSAKRHALAPDFVASGADVGFKKLVKPLIFTACFSGCCFVGATIWQYENMRKRSKTALEYSVYSSYSPTYKRGEIRRKFNLWWNRQTEGQKVASMIILSNVIVFLLWKVPHIQPFMVRYFCSSPSMKSVCLPMFLSTFSHYSFLHLAANMYVLYSFSSSSVALFGKEQFLALYCSAGVISSFISHIYKVATCRMGVSLGASGALMAILSSSCIQYPGAQLAVIFFPFLTISAGTAIKLVMAVDTAGVIAGWRFLDHAAHLGGALYGIGYLLYGSKYIWGNREVFMHWWHDLREKR